MYLWLYLRKEGFAVRCVQCSENRGGGEKKREEGGTSRSSSKSSVRRRENKSSPLNQLFPEKWSNLLNTRIKKYGALFFFSSLAREEGGRVGTSRTARKEGFRSRYQDLRGGVKNPRAGLLFPAYTGEERTFKTTYSVKMSRRGRKGNPGNPRSLVPKKKRTLHSRKRKW